MNSKTYGNEVLDVIFGFGWSTNESTRGWYEKREDGLWVAKHDGHMDNLLFGEELRVRFLHPTGRWGSEPALPIPFTEEQFKSFLNANALVTEPEVMGWFTDDDGHLDQVELSRIREFCPDAADLLEHLLDHPGGDCSEMASRGTRNATVKGVDTTNVDARSERVPGKVWTDAKKAELETYRKLHGTKAAAEHFGISRARVRQLLPSAVPRSMFSSLGSRRR